MNCERSKALVSVYVDGELSEELAGPLRRHLMECAACRASVSEAKALASWFVPSAPIGVPEGFAARVARLAVSGVVAPGAGLSGVPMSAAARGDDWLVPTRATHALRSVDRTARFAMSLAAVAAAVLIGLTVLLASGDGRGFDGPAIQAQPSLENALDALEELNRREAAPTAPQAGAQAPATVEPATEEPPSEERRATEPESSTEQPQSPR